MFCSICPMDLALYSRIDMVKNGRHVVKTYCRKDRIASGDDQIQWTSSRVGIKARGDVENQKNGGFRKSSKSGGHVSTTAQVEILKIHQGSSSLEYEDFVIN